MKKLIIIKDLIVLVALLTLAGCPATRQTDTSTLNIVPPAVDSSRKNDNTAVDPSQIVTAGDADANQRNELLKAETDKKSEHPALAKQLEVVYFGFDKHDLDSEALALLNRNFKKLAEDNSEYTLEGYCDEVGSAEYNIALGQKRADAVEKYLLARAISGERLSSVSYGKEYPADTDSTESARKNNRRVEFWTKSALPPEQRVRKDESARE